VTKTISGHSRTLCLIGLALLFTSSAFATISITVTPSPAGPQPVGTVITWTSTVTDTAPGAHQYRFWVGPAAGPLAIVWDYSQSNKFTWAAGETSAVGPAGVAFSMTEGTYQVKAVVQNTTNNTNANVIVNFVVTSLRTTGHDTVVPTANPLVALFAGPPCAVANTVRVRFNQTGSSVSQTTNAIPCNATNSANFYIAGMYPSTQYQMHHETVNPSGGIVQTGATYTFTTGPLPAGVTFPTQTVLTPAMAPGNTTAPILLHGFLLQNALITATDLSGNILWYYDLPVGELMRTEIGGRFLVTYSVSSNLYNNTFQEVDLAGNITLQTNSARINQELAAMTDPFTGKPRRPITQFDHEVRRLPNGNIAVKASSELLVTNAAQCGTSGGNPKTCDVLGMQVLILNPSLQIVWAWDAYDFLDLNRPAVTGDVCKQGQSGCPFFNLAPTAQDWLHGNSIQLVGDGSLLLSLRHQDWVVDINYNNGKGDGSVIWRLGNGGDFTMNNPPTNPLCSTPTQQQEFAWFSHQHDANFQYGAESVFTVFDNGVTWILGGGPIVPCDPSGHSRGYVLTVDVPNKTVTPLLIQDLGAYSNGFGTAEVVPGTSNYHFTNGQISKGTVTTNQEFSPAGVVEFAIQENHATYRSYRMQDMYTPAPPL
jgi:arylsulfate sulfotransferase